MSRYHTASFILILLLCATPVSADNSADVTPRLELDLVSLYNPLGISLSLKGYQRRIYQHSESQLWDGLYYQFGMQANINPAFSRLGVHLEWLPIGFLQLRVQSDRLFFSGSHGSLLAFPSSDAPFGDDDIESREGDEVSGTGSRSLLNLTLRARFGNIIIRNVTDFAYYEFPGQGPFYLEREYELLMASRDHLLSNQLYLLFEFSNQSGTTFIGPYYETIRVRESGLSRKRLGITWYREYTKPISSITTPRWYLQAGTYLHERNREDEAYLLFGIGGDI